MSLIIVNFLIIVSSLLLWTDIIPLSVLGVIQLIICCYHIYKHSPVKFPLGLFFLALVYLFHSGFALLFLQGYSFEEVTPGRYTLSDYGLAQIFTELAIFLYTVGYTSRTRVNIASKIMRIEDIEGKYFFIFFLICLPLYIASIYTRVNVARELGYLETYSVMSTPLFHYGTMFINSCVPMATILFVLYKKKVNFCRWLAVVMLLLSVYSMVSGQRILAIVGIISMGIIYFNVVSEINKKNILIIAAVVVFFIVFLPIVSNLRTYGNIDAEHISELQDIDNNGFLYSFILEFGDTVISLVFPILKTGETASYSFGLTYFLAPLNLSPILPGDLVESDFYKDALYFITRYPEAKSINFGGSILGEAYANFSWFGCVVLFFVGMLIRQIDSSIYMAKNGHVSFYSLLLIFVIPNLLRWVRDAFSCVFAFVFIVLYIIWLSSPKKNKL